MLYAAILLAIFQLFRPLRRVYWRFWPASVPASLGALAAGYAGDWAVAHGLDWPFPVPIPLAWALLGAFAAGEWGFATLGFFLRLPPAEDRREVEHAERR